MSALRHFAGESFHVPSGVYLLSHSVGCLPIKARRDLDEAFFDSWADSGSDAWPHWLASIDGFRRELAAVLGGEQEQWCPQPGVSAATFKLVSSLPQTRRRTVLISRHAFPSVGFALTGLESFGYRVRFVDGDPTDLANWRQALSPNVAAAVFMHVHSNSGLLSPVAELTDLARSAGVFSIVDICQSAGVIPLDVAASGADAVVGSCVKWLCGGPGAGFLWVDPRHIESLSPPDRGWFSHADPFAFEIDDFCPAQDARRFWGGTPSIAPYIVAQSGLRTIGRIGVDRVFAHNRQLFDHLRKMLPAEWADRIDLSGRGGTLCLDLGDCAQQAERLLRSAQCRIDRRGSILRISFHLFNTLQDAEELASAMGSMVKALNLS